MSAIAKKATTSASSKSVTTSRTKKAVSKKVEVQEAEKTIEQETAESFMSSFVFMEKTAAILDVSLETGKNVISLYSMNNELKDLCVNNDGKYVYVGMKPDRTADVSTYSKEGNEKLTI